ncbi:sigma-70 family RNA polymerase sigma factor [bacterium]|nr:MAG: sigma-70 family RNA polymerase sigma factor [bacterium]
MITEDSMQKYFKVADSYELLSFEREKELSSIIRGFKEGKQKQAAREELMNHNLKLVIKMAYQFYNNEHNQKRGELTLMDFVSAGNVGLMKAVDLYNPLKFKTRFTTYATAWIKQGILSLIHSYSTLVHIPMHIVDNSRKYKNITQKDKDSKLKDKDVMGLLDVTEAGLRNIKNSKVFTFSMDAPPPSKSYDEEEGTYKDFIRDTKQVSPYEETVKSDISDVIEKALALLDPVSRDIIQGQFLEPNKVRLSDLGKKHKMTGERVRQIKVIALNKLKWKLKGNSLTQI